MPHYYRLSTDAAHVAIAAVTRRLDGGQLRVYTGPMPPTSDAAPARDHTLLVEFRFDTPAFHPPVQREAVARPPVGTAIARADGEAHWFRCLDAAGQPVMDARVGQIDRDEHLGVVMLIVTTHLQVGVVVDLKRLTYSLPAHHEAS